MIYINKIVSLRDKITEESHKTCLSTTSIWILYPGIISYKNNVLVNANIFAKLVLQLFHLLVVVFAFPKRNPISSILVDQLHRFFEISTELFGQLLLFAHALDPVLRWLRVKLCQHVPLIRGYADDLSFCLPDLLSGLQPTLSALSLIESAV